MDNCRIVLKTMLSESYGFQKDYTKDEIENDCCYCILTLKDLFLRLGMASYSIRFLDLTKNFIEENSNFNDLVDTEV